MNLERRAVDLVASLAPWFAPLPTAWLVYDRTMRSLAWPWYVAAVAGLTLELLGVGILATWLMLHGYNRDKRKTDPAAVMWLPIGLVLLYVLTAEALTIVLDVWPAMATIAPALFPVLSVAAFALLALRANHDRRLTNIEQDKTAARARREQRRTEQSNAPTKPEPVQPFVCLLCGAAFDSQSALNGHGNKHRRNNGKEPSHDHKRMAH